MPRWLTPKEIADELAIDAGKVLAWLHSGELVGVDVSENRGGRPRWRISAAEFEAFLQRRQSRPTTTAPRRRKRAVASEDFF